MDKQNQIEEIILVVKEQIANNAVIDFEEDTVSFNGNDFDHIGEQTAEALYNAGYRKIPEGAVVLTKEAYSEFLEMQRLKKMFDGDAVKQTAYTILREIGTTNLLKRGKTFGDLTDEERAALKSYCDRMLRKVKEIAKRYDVKVTADKEDGE